MLLVPQHVLKGHYTFRALYNALTLFRGLLLLLSILALRRFLLLSQILWNVFNNSLAVVVVFFLCCWQHLQHSSLAQLLGAFVLNPAIASGRRRVLVVRYNHLVHDLLLFLLLLPR
uniref:(northern house mosquito) hypothetical protein n=1 Tax=Culex pipiens TaxID=7175 RepID=A0A8D8BY20_CULPI